MSVPGKWVINAMDPRSGVKWKTWIVHKCRKVSGTNYYFLASLTSKSCPTCDTPIPRDIFESWKSQNAHMQRYCAQLMRYR